MTYKIDHSRLASLLALHRAKQQAPLVDNALSDKPTLIEVTNNGNTNTIDINSYSNSISRDNNSLAENQGTGRTGEVITYNSEQLDFINRAGSGKSVVLIGAAGTGKTTCVQGAMRKLVDSGIAGILDSGSHKYLGTKTPGIVICAFTRRAVNNIRRVMPADMKNNCITIHKLLEYEPDYFEVYDPVAGETKRTMRFVATRNRHNPLPDSIHTIVFEESSMVSSELHNEVSEACPHRPQFVYLGDIQQLPPVFGSAILGYKMLELPTIELTQVYRQALESPIIRLAHRILSGRGIPASEYPEWKIPNKLTIHPWKKKLHPDLALLTIAKFFTTAYDAGVYNTDEDIILIPFNKSCGTDELNKHIAQHIARKGNQIVYEIIAGFNKFYCATGDRILYDKEDAIITGIKVNRLYTGKSVQPASLTLDYWGHDPAAAQNSNIEFDDDEMDFMLSAAANIESEDRVRQASHVLTIKLLDSEREITVDSAAAINGILLSYALTVHKSQGSEWRKVFLVLHQSHATMLQRELLYTAVTRAKEELYIICEPESFEKGIKSQRIRGNSLAEKAQFFKGKLEDMN